MSDEYRLCCDYDEFSECLGVIGEDDPMYEERRLLCEMLYCDVKCLERMRKG